VSYLFYYRVLPARVFRQWLDLQESAGLVHNGITMIGSLDHTVAYYHYCRVVLLLRTSVLCCSNWVLFDRGSHRRKMIVSTITWCIYKRLYSSSTEGPHAAVPDEPLKLMVHVVVFSLLLSLVNQCLHLEEARLHNSFCYNPSCLPRIKEGVPVTCCCRLFYPIPLLPSCISSSSYFQAKSSVSFGSNHRS
jgi:hypothetical protein